MSHAPPLPAFDDEVVRAMAKWPDVPCCYGWLTLDTRGYWRIQGEIVRHARAQAFLSRHYRADAHGRWYVQNGPQQVFVDLDYTPWVYRYQAPASLRTHSGVNIDTVIHAYLDDDGNLLLETAYGVGVLDDRDLTACAGLIDFSDDGATARAFTWSAHALPVTTLKRADVPRLFAFTPRPR